VTVGSGGASSIEFTSISSSYQHLQVRIIGRGTDTANTGGRYINVRFNGDSAGNYASHQLRGDGGSADASGFVSTAQIYGQRMANGYLSTNVFGALVFDLLDYSSTSKNKTYRGVGGWDSNGSGQILVTSGAWFSTSAITSIAMTLESGNWAQYSTAALYGVKAP
jgi:hypothetical protein